MDWKYFDEETEREREEIFHLVGPEDWSWPEQGTLYLTNFLLYFSTQSENQRIENIIFRINFTFKYVLVCSTARDYPRLLNKVR